MKRVTKIIEVTYNVYEPGELVKPSSPRCPLEPGIYRVTKCVEPTLPYEFDSMIFVEGPHKYGVSAEYLMLAEDDE